VYHIYQAAMGSYVLLPVVLAALACKSAAYTVAAQNDRIVSLPGATSALLSSQFSGYLNVSSTRGIHYMYFESERDPEKDPVIFWTNGGPGTFLLVASCSPQLVTYAPLSSCRLLGTSGIVHRIRPMAGSCQSHSYTQSVQLDEIRKHSVSGTACRRGLLLL
jgi:hypothetical protein